MFITQIRLTMKRRWGRTWWFIFGVLVSVMYWSQSFLRLSAWITRYLCYHSGLSLVNTKIRSAVRNAAERTLVIVHVNHDRFNTSWPIPFEITDHRCERKVWKENVRHLFFFHRENVLSVNFDDHVDRTYILIYLFIYSFVYLPIIIHSLLMGSQ